MVIGLNENEIFVSDDGCGIPEDKLPEITEPFYKLDQSRNTEEMCIRDRSAPVAENV